MRQKCTCKYMWATKVLKNVDIEQGELVYWPRINDDIEVMCRKCSICMVYIDQQPKAPLLTHELPINELHE